MVYFLSNNITVNHISRAKNANTIHNIYCNTRRNTYIPQVSTLAGDLFTAEVVNERDVEDESKPFVEFMVGGSGR